MRICDHSRHLTAIRFWPLRGASHLATADDLRSLPTISTAQADDLKIDAEGYRFWLARTGPEDGEPYADKITIEHYTASGWRELTHYPGSETWDGRTYSADPSCAHRYWHHTGQWCSTCEGWA